MQFSDCGIPTRRNLGTAQLVRDRSFEHDIWQGLQAF
jgi:hypothetical protein